MPVNSPGVPTVACQESAAVPGKLYQFQNSPRAQAYTSWFAELHPHIRLFHPVMKSIAGTRRVTLIWETWVTAASSTPATTR